VTGCRKPSFVKYRLNLFLVEKPRQGMMCTSDRCLVRAISRFAGSCSAMKRREVTRICSQFAVRHASEAERRPSGLPRAVSLRCGRTLAVTTRSTSFRALWPVHPLQRGRISSFSPAGAGSSDGGCGGHHTVAIAGGRIRGVHASVQNLTGVTPAVTQLLSAMACCDTISFGDKAIRLRASRTNEVERCRLGPRY
jgi:hypothetical protein